MWCFYVLVIDMWVYVDGLCVHVTILKPKAIFQKWNIHLREGKKKKKNPSRIVMYDAVESLQGLGFQES